MSIQMQFLQTTLNTQSFSISGGRGIVINILAIKNILLINQYFNHICTQVWILCSSFECVFKMFFGRNTACFQCFFDRNTCKVCKCPRERHDIYNENFVNIRDRLGWKRNDDPSAQVSKDRTLREGYTWIPPGLSSEQVN